MKKLIAFVLALVMALSMTACAKEEAQPTAAATEAPAATEAAPAVETTEAVTVPEETEAEEEIVPETTAAEETLPEETVSETVAEETVPEAVAEEENAAEAVTEDLAAGSDAADAVVLNGKNNLLAAWQIERHRHTIAEPLAEGDPFGFRPCQASVVRPHQGYLLLIAAGVRSLVGKVYMHLAIGQLQGHRFPASVPEVGIGSVEVARHAPATAAIVRYGIHYLVGQSRVRVRAGVPHIQQSAVCQLQQLAIGKGVPLGLSHSTRLAPCRAIVITEAHKRRITGIIDHGIAALHRLYAGIYSRSHKGEGILVPPYMDFTGLAAHKQQACNG